MTLLFTYITLLILLPILHRNLPIIHYGCLLFSILFRLVYSLLITFHYHKLHHHLLIPFTNIYYKIIKYNAPLDLQVNTSLINPYHSNYKPQLVSSNNFSIAGFEYHLKMNLVLLTFNHLNPLKSFHCIDYIMCFL